MWTADNSTSLLKFHQHAAPIRPHFPNCVGAPIVADATQLSLAAWNVVLLKQLLLRRRMSQRERQSVRSALGDRWFAKARNYMTLKHTLHHAIHGRSPEFVRLATEKKGLFLEFGVLTGLSANLTSLYINSIPGIPAETRLEGFDTFTGLPEAWPNGKGGFYYKKGTFSWAARNKGPTPPVKPRVRLHTGLFNNTLPPFLRDPSLGLNKPLAYTNIDCDLYGGTVDALQNLGPRMCIGTLIHFHELLKDRFWKAKHLEKGNYDAVVASEEARALYEWLRARPTTVLELSDVQSSSNSDAAVLVVRTPPDDYTRALC